MASTKSNLNSDPSEEQSESSARAESKAQAESKARGMELLAAIEHQIIPRLMLAHGREPQMLMTCGDERGPPTAREIEEFGYLAVRQETRQLTSLLAKMASEGLSFRALLLDVIAPTADWLGDRWMDDTLSYTEVTAGAGILERVAAALGESSDPPLRHEKLIVLTAVGGEQHVLPMHLLGETLRHEGWEVLVDPRIPPEDLRELVAEEQVAAVGFTCRDIKLMTGFAELVASVRACSNNRDIGFYVVGTPGLALRASSYGATYCHTFDDFLNSLNPPSAQEDR